MKWMILTLCLGIVGNLGVAAPTGPSIDAKKFELLSSLPARVSQAVFVGGKLYFSLERTDDTACPSRDLFVVSLDPAALSKVVERISGDLSCVLRLETDDKELFVQYRTPSQKPIHLAVLVGKELVPFDQHPTMGSGLRNRKAWLKVQLHVLAEKLGAPAIQDAFIASWVVKKHPLSGEDAKKAGAGEKTETFLHFLMLSGEEKPSRKLYGYFPLINEDRKKRGLVALTESAEWTLPLGAQWVVTDDGWAVTSEPWKMFSTQTGKVEADDEASPLLKTLLPHYLTSSSDGVTLWSGFRNVGAVRNFENQLFLFTPGKKTLTPIKGENRDVSGLSPLQGGLLVTKGWTGSVLWTGSREPEGELKKWELAKTYTLSSSENGKAQPVASALFVTPKYPHPMQNIGCASHRFEWEKNGTIGVYRVDGRESVPLGWFEGVTSGACSGPAFAVLAKKFIPQFGLGHLKNELEAEGTEKAGEGGTNVAEALALKSSDPIKTLVSQLPHLYVMQRDALVLVRKALSPTSFFRVRPDGAVGFFLWLQAGEATFTDYVNTAAGDGRDFYQTNIIDHPLPAADAKFIEAVAK